MAESPRDQIYQVIDRYEAAAVGDGTEGKWQAHLHRAQKLAKVARCVRTVHERWPQDDHLEPGLGGNPVKSYLGLVRRDRVGRMG